MKNEAQRKTNGIEIENATGAHGTHTWAGTQGHTGGQQRDTRMGTHTGTRTHGHTQGLRAHGATQSTHIGTWAHTGAQEHKTKLSAGAPTGHAPHRVIGARTWGHSGQNGHTANSTQHTAHKNTATGPQGGAHWGTHRDTTYNTNTATGPHEGGSTNGQTNVVERLIAARADVFIECEGREKGRGRRRTRRTDNWTGVVDAE